ncbi:MAG: DUF1905 domain-containing protein [Bacteroidota bacterium]|nr:DUF1905 domain-containing protein [Bacteroidota bacterium]
MLSFTTEILKFGKQGEKTGWSYIIVSGKQAIALGHSSKKSFRVKGFVDNYAITNVALLPMGDGSFILPLNIAIRRAIKKNYGAKLEVRIELDVAEPTISKELLECLSDEPSALQYFTSLPKSHQNYYSKWVESAKTVSTKTRRISLALAAMERKMSFSEMMRASKE